MRGTLKFSKAGLLMVLMSLSSLAAMAQPKENTLSNPLAQALLVIMVLLLLAIVILANVVNNAAGMFRDKLRKEREAGAGGKLNTTLGVVVLIGIAMLLPQVGYSTGR